MSSHSLRRHRARLILVIGAGLLPLAGVDCLTTSGVDPLSAFLDTTQVPSSGYVAVVYLNHSKTLVTPILVLTYPKQPPLVWVNSVAPESWESILPEWGLTQLTLVGIVPVDLKTETTGQRIDYSGKALTARQDIASGSIVVVEIFDAPVGATSPLSIQVRTVPDTLTAEQRALRTGPTTPRPDTGLLLLRPELVSGISTELTASWEDNSGLIYVLKWQLAGQGPGVASIVECPVDRVGWGNLARPSDPGAKVGGGQELPAPAPLTGGVGFHCGNAIIFRETGKASDPADIQLSLAVTTEGSEVATGEIDLFGNLRTLLADTGFAGRQSNTNALLPTPGVLSPSGQ